EVLTLVARGMSNSEIAAHLHLSGATVKTHIGRLLAKLGARDRAQLVIVAYETGLVTPRATACPPSRRGAGRAQSWSTTAGWAGSSARTTTSASRHGPTSRS